MEEGSANNCKPHILTLFPCMQLLLSKENTNSFKVITKCKVAASHIIHPHSRRRPQYRLRLRGSEPSEEWEQLRAETKCSHAAGTLTLNPVDFSVPSLGCFFPSFIISYQWGDKDNSFAFLHFACGVSWLPALPFPVPGPQEDPLSGRAYLQRVAAGRPLSHRLRLW